MTSSLRCRVAGYASHVPSACSAAAAGLLCGRLRAGAGQRWAATCRRRSPGAAAAVPTISPFHRPFSVYSSRVEQALRRKMHVLSGALAAQPHYPLLVLNNYSADSNKLTGHRKHA